MISRRPQFSLMSLLWLMVVVAFGCAIVPPVWTRIFPPSILSGESIEDYARRRMRDRKHDENQRESLPASQAPR